MKQNNLVKKAEGLFVEYTSIAATKGYNVVQCVVTDGTKRIVEFSEDDESFVAAADESFNKAMCSYLGYNYNPPKKTTAPKPEVKVEAPKAEAKTEAKPEPKPEVKVETPKAEAPKAEAPKPVETPKSEGTAVVSEAPEEVIATEPEADADADDIRIEVGRFKGIPDNHITDILKKPGGKQFLANVLSIPNPMASVKPSYDGLKAYVEKHNLDLSK